MTGKRDHLYFELLQEGVRYAVEAAAQLQNDLEHFDASVLNQQIDTMHELEHQADLTKHQAMEKLIREFITPLEREDILGLTSAIDDVTDSIEDVLLRLYMFNIHELRPDALEFSRIVAQCGAGLQDLMDEFPHFRKSKTIREKIIEINHLEEIGDRLYTEAMHRLHTERPDAVEILSWTTIYDRFEKCCDMCEHVADSVELVILKNS